MNKLLTSIATIVALTATSAIAQSQSDYATVIRVKPVYENVRVPTSRTQCNSVNVPVYGQERFDQGSAIVGGLIGGLIGNQFGKGEGKTAMTGIGAITGAIVGGKQETGIVGYRKETRCEDIIFYEEQERIKNYSITYEWNSIRQQGYTLNRYQVGDRIPVNISIQAK
tara:strand:- start:101 stop:604 length:504 start_codon:yes stop_codon:yes gene_type:complete